MPYPSKTSREAILDAAVQQVEREGLARLSLRSLASSLELAPTALYRYFADRAHLEAAIANEGLSRLHVALTRAASKGEAEQAIRRVAKAYMDFARNNPSLYSVIMQPVEVPDEGASVHEAMWVFSVGLLGRLTGPQRAPEAAVALWAFLHGMVALDQGGVFGPQKPRTSFNYGLNAFLAGMSRLPI